jgi:hypothetical protein
VLIIKLLEFKGQEYSPGQHLGKNKSQINRHKKIRTALGFTKQQIKQEGSVVKKLKEQNYMSRILQHDVLQASRLYKKFNRQEFREYSLRGLSEVSAKTGASLGSAFVQLRMFYILTGLRGVKGERGAMATVAVKTSKWSDRQID